MEPRRIGAPDNTVEERKPFFYLVDEDGGEDYLVTVPATVPPNFSMRYLNNVKNYGVERAWAMLIEDLIGTEAMDAIANSTTISDEDMEWINDQIEKIALSANRKLLGKSGKGRRR